MQNYKCSLQGSTSFYPSFRSKIVIGDRDIEGAEKIAAEIVAAGGSVMLLYHWFHVRLMMFSGKLWPLVAM